MKRCGMEGKIKQHVAFDVFGASRVLYVGGGRRRGGAPGVIPHCLSRLVKVCRLSGGIASFLEAFSALFVWSGLADGDLSNLPEGKKRASLW